MNVLLSIKPKWAKLIYEGKKKVEWRKNKPLNFNFSEDVIFLYETAPVFAVTGFLKLSDTYELNPIYLNSCIKNDLFTKRYYEELGLVNFQDLKRYARNKNLYAWHIKEFYKIAPQYVNRFSPSEKPPQSWCYTKAFLCNNGLNFDHGLKLKSFII